MRLRRSHSKDIFKVLFIFTFVAAFTFLALRLPKTTTAVSHADFRAGNIISDYVMSKSDSMSVEEIQSFLTQRGNCNDTNTWRANNYPSYHYHIKDGRFVCLANERFALSGTNYGDLLEDGEESATAAEIIYSVAQEYKINPQVLLVLLEKEQGLISDSWPNSRQFKVATGYGCPDTAPCNEKYYGFKNQLSKAAELFRTVLDGGWTNYPLGENYIYYNPNSSCGGSTVNIENLATSALYRYTPYQPNEAALSVGYGTASCGAYGNRNFFYLFVDWFGDPTITNTPVYEPFSEPRYLKVKSTTERINPFTSETVDTIEEGLIRKYTSKILLPSGWCYRTEYSTNASIDACVPASQLEEITFVYEEIPSDEQEKIITSGAAKITLNSGAKTMEISPYIIRNFVAKTSFLGVTYYITEFDAKHNNSKYGIPEEYIVDSYTPLDSPQSVFVSQTSERVNPFTLETYDSLEKGRTLTFTGSIIRDGQEYYRTEFNTLNQINAATKKEDLSTPTVDIYEDFQNPREMVLLENVKRINPFTGELYDTLPKGKVIKFSTKIIVNGVWYYRTEHNTLNQINAAIPASSLGEV